MLLEVALQNMPKQEKEWDKQPSVVEDLATCGGCHTVSLQEQDQNLMQQSNYIDNDLSLVVSNNGDDSSEPDREDKDDEYSEENHGNDDQIQALVADPWSIYNPTIK